jgi:DNA-binding response OmpR family regulator
MTTKRKVLVIDDDEDFGIALTIFFADKPYQLFLALTLAEGMVLLERERPDHIFLDNSLPDGQGWEKTEFILANYPKVQINLISALRIPRPSGAIVRVLDKPIHLNDMLDCMK